MIKPAPPTAEELADFCRVYGVERAAFLLGRTPSAIYQQLRRMGKSLRPRKQSEPK